VNFVVNISLQETRAKARSDRGGPPAAPNTLRGHSATPTQASVSVFQAASRGRDAAAAVLDTSHEAAVLPNRADNPEVATPRASRLLASYARTLDEVAHLEPPLVHAGRPGVPLLSGRRAVGLTGREREILALVAEGPTNGEVASALGISPATVGKHLEHVYAKLGVTSRTAAVHCAREHRIIAS
jgi:DNA-binding CsgD family transcriptional regulator